MLQSILSACCLLLCLTETLSADEVLFEKDIRPILKAHCFQCHGEAGDIEAGLDLRLRRLILAGGESGAAIDVTSPEESLLLQRVIAGEMPPGEGQQLSQPEIAKLRAWVHSGARTARAEPENADAFTEEERSYWAFQPVIRPKVPQLKNERIRTPIDAFILSRQDSFAADASRVELIRRASFDLIGLPPDPKAVDQFTADENSTAWPQLIDKLLSSPQYGERWGRHWLDVAGYADSEGYSDEDRVRPHAWRYRDYVIRAFNDDKPFDVFVQEQLAGDEMVPLPHQNLSPQAIEKLTATGFLRMAPDGTASGNVNQNEARNQVVADTLQILGSSLLGLTVNCAQCHDHRYDPIPTKDYYQLRAIFEPALNWKQWKTPAGRQISLYTDADKQQAAQIEAKAKLVDDARAKKAAEYITRTLEEELLLVPEDVRDPLRAAYRAPKKTDAQTALLKEYPSVQNISEGSLYLYDRRRAANASKLDAERRDLLAKALKEATATAGQAVTEANLAEFNPEAARQVQQLADQANELRNSKAADDLKTYSEKAKKIRAEKPEEGFLRVLTEPVNAPAATFVFYRGDHEQPKEQVGPSDLSILGGASIADNDPSLVTTGRRLAFARQLTNGQHPLFARVIVNRIWLHHFGRGLVNSPGDFGTLGTRPTHPKLLDWLAAEFVDSGWSVKHMHRLIMSSTVYRQSAVAGSDQSADLYAAYPVRRLEAEVVRDAVLSVAGLLNEKQFGPPVPVMEDAVGRIVIGKENLDGERKPTKAVDLQGEEFRRSIYIQVRRTRTLSIFETFDAPALNPNCSKRSYSTSTPQSLLMMNSDFAVEMSAAFAKRVIEEVGDNEGRIRRAWRLAFAEAPAATDVESALAFITQLRKVASAEGDAGENATQQAFSVWCQALLSSNRFLHVE